MLSCGHNICRSCLRKYSTAEHPRNSIRCTVCYYETDVAAMKLSIPNTAIIEIILDAEQVLGHKFFSGINNNLEGNQTRSKIKDPMKDLMTEVFRNM